MSHPREAQIPPIRPGRVHRARLRFRQRLPTPVPLLSVRPSSRELHGLPLAPHCSYVLSLGLRLEPVMAAPRKPVTNPAQVRYRHRCHERQSKCRALQRSRESTLAADAGEAPDETAAQSGRVDDVAFAAAAAVLQDGPVAGTVAVRRSTHPVKDLLPVAAAMLPQNEWSMCTPGQRLKDVIEPSPSPSVVRLSPRL